MSISQHPSYIVHDSSVAIALHQSPFITITTAIIIITISIIAITATFPSSRWTQEDVATEPARQSNARKTAWRHTHCHLPAVSKLLATGRTCGSVGKERWAATLSSSSSTPSSSSSSSSSSSLSLSSSSSQLVASS